MILLRYRGNSVVERLVSQDTERPPSAGVFFTGSLSSMLDE